MVYHWHKYCETPETLRTQLSQLDQYGPDELRFHSQADDEMLRMSLGVRLRTVVTVFDFALGFVASPQSASEDRF